MRFIEICLNEPDKEVVALADALFPFPGHRVTPTPLPRAEVAGKRSPPRLTQLPAREARLTVYNKANNETTIWIVQLKEVYAKQRGGHHRGTVKSVEVIPDVQPAMVGGLSGSDSCLL